MGRTEFSASDIDTFRKLIAAKQGRSESEQRDLREEMRRAGFFISDFGTFPNGITVAQFDALLASGRVTVRPPKQTDTPK